ncbi:hypothetical protein [Aeromonas veronii]|uniref:hypothetical protein n=1 Tax=Aeromonas veronii TaxID=654 RepID=UPI003BA09779
MKRVGLFDLDIFAYHAAAASEVETDWGDGLWTLHSYLDDAIAQAEDEIESLSKKLKLDTIILCVTSSWNWRMSVLPTYKGNRKDVRKPLVLNRLKDELGKKYQSVKIEGLEADDVMGILATSPLFMPDHQKIIISEDKDMKGIPCFLFNPRNDEREQEITEEAADKWFLTQALIGDPTDGYSGCPGAGPVLANELFSENVVWEQYEHTFKTGPRKGIVELRMRKVPNEGSLWNCVMSAYSKAGCDEEFALTQARVARILRFEDFDFTTMKPILWTPDRISI